MRTVESASALNAASDSIETTFQLQWFPTFSPTGLLVIAGGLFALVLLIKLIARRPLYVGHRGLSLLRLAVFTIIAVILLAPTLIRWQPSPPQRAEMVIIVDGSRSMSFEDNQGSRWASSIGLVRDALSQAGEAASDVHVYHFGHRLLPLKLEGKAKQLSLTSRLVHRVRVILDWPRQSGRLLLVTAVADWLESSW